MTASLFSMHPPASSPPALVQTQSSFAPISIAGETPVHSQNLSATSPLSPGGRGDGGEGATAPSTTSPASTASPWTWLTSPFIVNLQGLPPPDPSLDDPLWLDSLPSHKPGSQLSDSGPPSATPPASADGGGTGGGSAFSSGSASTFFGAGGVSPLSLANGLAGLASSGASGSSTSGTPVANAPGSIASAPSLPTNILLAPSVPPLTSNDSSLITHNLSPSNPQPPPISPDGGPGGGHGPLLLTGGSPVDIVPDMPQCNS